MIQGNQPFHVISASGGSTHAGVTIRTQLAAMAMQGLLSNANRYNDVSNYVRLAAVTAVECADALIEELNKTQKEG